MVWFVVKRLRRERERSVVRFKVRNEEKDITYYMTSYEKVTRILPCITTISLPRSLLWGDVLGQERLGRQNLRQELAQGRPQVHGLLRLQVLAQDQVAHLLQQRAPVGRRGLLFFSVFST